MSRRRAFARFPLLLASLALLSPPASAGPGDGAPAPVAPPTSDTPLAPFDGDPAGDATRADAAAAALLAAGDAVGAAARWMDLAEKDPAALLSVPPPIGAPGLWWPAREVAQMRLGDLPPAGAAAVESRWGGLAASLVDEARGGAIAPLLRAARDLPTTAAGGLALLSLAEDALLAGDGEPAATHFSRWLALRRRDPPATRAAVGMRLLDARLLAGDELGLSLAFRSLLDVAEVPVRRGDETTTIAKRAPEAVAELRARESARAEKPAAGSAPADPSLSTEVLWSMPLGDPKTGGVAWPTPEASVAVSGGSLFVCEERRVRRLDLETGLLRWNFPEAATLPGDYAAQDRYWASDRPRRAVVLAGEVVLALLGDPPVARESTFRSGNEFVDVVRRGRESRSRLVALDAATGRLRWTTGGAHETHPVLGAQDVGVTSPPLLDGDRVYVSLSARRGAVECWLACLDLATGAPRFVTYLGRAENALGPPADPNARELVSECVSSVPAGQTPSRRGDEVCTVPGPGFAAGVGASDGRLVWVASLPRYSWGGGHIDRNSHALELTEPQEAVRNVPLPANACWFVAAATSPRTVALEAGSGRLRWVQAAVPTQGGLPFPRLPHLLAARADLDGRVRLLLAGGDGVARIDAATGRADSGMVGWTGVQRRSGERVDCGRPALYGPHTVAWRSGVLCAAGDAAAPATPGGKGAAEQELGAHVDLVRAGDTWLLVGTRRLVALAPGAVAERIASTAPIDSLDAALRAARRAGRTKTDADLARAASETAKAKDWRAEEALADAATRCLELKPERQMDPRAPEAVTFVLRHTERLPATRRGAIVDRACRILVERGAWEDLAAVADAWTAWGRDGTVRDAGGGETRGDLAALAYLRAAANWAKHGRPPKALVLREDRAAAALFAREPTAPATCPRDEDLRGIEGTVAAWDARLSLLARAIDEGRGADAAATASDLRLSPPLLAPLSAAASQALVAIEAEGLVRAGEGAAAREVLFDAMRAGPAAARTADGVPASALSTALEADFAFVARRGVAPLRIDVWGEGRPAPGPAALAATKVLQPTGPGATPALELALVARGERVEVRPASGAAARAVPPSDVGYVGMTLLDRETFVSGEGLPVARVDPGTPAERAGLREGDVVLSLGGVPATDRAEVARRVAAAKPGTAFVVETLRRGFPLSHVVEVVERSEAADDVALPPRAWLPTSDEAIVASRHGLRRVVLATGEARDLWSAPGAAPVADFSGFAGVLYVATGVTVDQDARLFAVLAQTGRTLWSAPLPGAATGPPKVFGSAVVVDVATGRTLAFDARTGSLRASRSARLSPFGATGPPASHRAAGTVVLISVNDTLAFLNPATGDLVEVVLPADSVGDADRLYAPLLASGGVVALAVGGREVRAYVPSLVSLAPPAEPVVVGEARLFVSHPMQGPLNENSRLLVGGDVVYIARRSFGGAVTVAAFEVDRAALESPRGSDPVIWHPYQRVDPPAATSEERRSGSVVVAAKANLDGLWILATIDRFAGDLSPGRASWFEPTHGDLLVSVSTSESVPHVEGPVRVGKNAWIPVDGGFLVLPLVAPPPR